MQGKTNNETAQACSQATNKHISTGWVNTQVRRLRETTSLKRSYKLSLEEHQTIIAYAIDNHQKHGAPRIDQWISNTGRSLPKPYKPPVPKKTKSEVSKKAQPSYTDRDIQRIVKKEVERALKERSPVGQLESNQTKKKRDQDVDPLHKKVNSFVFEHAINASETWRWLQKLFEQRNAVKVYRIEGQTFPQWLRHSGWLDTMMSQLQGFLDYMHDELTQGRNQRSLDL
jgi:predicted solute-binding protein